MIYPAAADEMSACRSSEDLPVTGTRTDLLVRFDAFSWTLNVAHPNRELSPPSFYLSFVGISLGSRHPAPWRLVCTEGSCVQKGLEPPT